MFPLVCLLGHDDSRILTCSPCSHPIGLTTSAVFKLVRGVLLPHIGLGLLKLMPVDIATSRCVAAESRDYLLMQLKRHTLRSRTPITFHPTNR